MTSRQLFIFSTSLIACFGTLISSIDACPFCSAQSQTFSEELASMDAVVIAKLVKRPPATSSTASDASDLEIAKAQFEIVEVIKGKAEVGNLTKIETLYFGDGKVGQSFLIMGVDPPKLMWSTPLRLTESARTYITKLPTVPKKGVDRLRFFQAYLENEDEMLARDAYDEFANAPYNEITVLKPHMIRDRLVKWIKSEDVPASRRRLYLTMLGVCGGMQDLTMLEEMMRSSDRKMKAGLDAMIGCYLTLSGEKGMPVVEELFLKNKKAEYADTYAAIMALRFHGTEGNVIPKQRVVEGLRHMLDRPKLADLVIPDLARWQDWTVMPKLVQLFKDADDKSSSWVRVPVINFLRACPLPKAKEYISELEKVDPAAVKRANTFFPFTPSPAPGASSSGWQRPESKTMQVAKIAIPDQEPAPAALVRDGDEVANANRVALSPTATKPTVAQVAVATDGGLHPLLLIGASLFFGATLFLLMWSILRGTGEPGRSSV
jgi:hypothetical protein